MSRDSGGVYTPAQLVRAWCRGMIGWRRQNRTGITTYLNQPGDVAARNCVRMYADDGVIFQSSYSCKAVPDYFGRQGQRATRAQRIRTVLATNDG